FPKSFSPNGSEPQPMKIVENLSALALRQLIDGASPSAGNGAKGAELVRQQLEAQGEKVRHVLRKTCQHTWAALELALAGPGWWEAARGRLTPDEQTALGPKVQALFAVELLGDLSAYSAAALRQCLHELRTAKREQRLTGDLN